MYYIYWVILEFFEETNIDISMQETQRRIHKHKHIVRL